MIGGNPPRAFVFYCGDLWSPVCRINGARLGVDMIMMGDCPSRPIKLWRGPYKNHIVLI